MKAKGLCYLVSLGLIAVVTTARVEATLIVTNDLQVWLKADAIDPTPGGTDLRSDSTIKLWPNQSSAGSLNDAGNTAVGGDGSPTYLSSVPIGVVNGPAAHFDGVSDGGVFGDLQRLRRTEGAGNPIHGASAFTISLVLKVDSLAADRQILGNRRIESTVNGDRVVGMSVYATPGNAGVGINPSSIMFINGHTNATANSIRSTPVNSVGTGEFFILTLTWTNAATPLHIYLDGVEQALTPWTGDAVQDYLDWGTNLELGLGESTVSYSRAGFVGDVAEVLIYDRVLSGEELGLLHTYLDETYFTSVVPEPTVSALIAVGALVLGWRGRRRSAH